MRNTRQLPTATADNQPRSKSVAPSRVIVININTPASASLMTTTRHWAGMMLRTLSQATSKVSQSSEAASSHNQHSPSSPSSAIHQS
mmetsp:Transcript_43341/g.77899  ORF Transcript_43341/g.77899 Transcript_43341/m.77899 type:complete len:87 (-) Transcript_43341:690-950(-)